MFPNLVGIVNSLLMTISVLAGQNDPQYKVTPVGFLQMLLENSSTATVSNFNDLRAGLDREIKVRYMQRGTESDVDDIDDCETKVTAVWQQTTIGAPMYSKEGIYLDDNLVRQLEMSAANPVTIGSESANVYLALYQTILTNVNGLIQKINNNLLAAQATKWGTNVAYGNNAAQPINFSNEPQMNDGIVKLIYDYQFNEIAGTPQIVGNGIITRYDILQGLKKGIDSGGFGANPVNVYPDFNSISAWGPNHFGVFVPGLTSFVDYNMYAGNFKGAKGGSLFFTIPIPIQLAGGKLTKLVLDCQLKYNDCPIRDDAGKVIAERGWSLLLSKRYGLWNAPDDMFKATDRMNEFNGSLHYIGSAL